MNNRKKNISYILVPTFDGVHRAFPVSKHVLDTKHRRLLNLRQKALAMPTAVRHWRPSILQQVSTLALMLTLCASSYGITYGKLNATLSYFRDTEISRFNMFAAGLLGFRVNPGHSTETIAEDAPVFLHPLMEPDQESFPVMYRITAEETGGPSPLCAALEAHATGTPFVYDGKLLALTTDATTTPGHWGVEVSVPPGVPDLMDGMTCDVDFVYQGWDETMPEGAGYTDEERDSFTFVFDAPEPVVMESLVAPEENSEDIVVPFENASTTDQVTAEDENAPEPPPQEEPPVVEEESASADET